MQNRKELVDKCEWLLQEFSTETHELENALKAKQDEEYEARLQKALDDFIEQNHALLLRRINKIYDEILFETLRQGIICRDEYCLLLEQVKSLAVFLKKDLGDINDLLGLQTYVAESKNDNDPVNLKYLRTRLEFSQKKLNALPTDEPINDEKELEELRLMHNKRIEKSMRLKDWMINTWENQFERNAGWYIFYYIAAVVSVTLLPIGGAVLGALAGAAATAWTGFGAAVGLGIGLLAGGLLGYKAAVSCVSAIPEVTRVEFTDVTQDKVRKANTSWDKVSNALQQQPQAGEENIIKLKNRHAFSNIIAKQDLEKIPKPAFFEKIKQLDKSEQKTMLKACLDTNTTLGKHFSIQDNSTNEEKTVHQQMKNQLRFLGNKKVNTEAMETYYRVGKR